MGDMVKAPHDPISIYLKETINFMIISKQRIINEYLQLSSQQSADSHALQAVAKLLGIAEHLVAETIDEAFSGMAA
ncbi:hypothetical protein GCM10011396_13630 [Undibacterium terreum]|uniref:Uncharacterized protein n=2 Tax=Undibacterium terreum TaxID=1224302 RepID=A0A916UBZ2_9BURK|nr:hypothetical protein GCM10011396_13630 [Undibacterium terreum]